MISEENDQGQVLTTVWIQIDAFHPSCNYSKAQESNFQITISFKEGTETPTTTPTPTNPTPKTPTNPTTPTLENETHIPKPRGGAVTTLTARPIKTSTSEGSTGTTIDAGQPSQVCENPADTLKELSKTAFQGETISLKRWREYEIRVTIKDLTTDKELFKTFRHNTYRWVCPGNCHKTISQKEFCDGTPHCPGGADESKKNCEVSKMPQKTAYAFYGYMMFIITIYWMFLGFERDEQVEPTEETNPVVRDFQKEEYKQSHSTENFSKPNEVRERLFNKLFDVNDDQATDICQQVRDVETEVHPNSMEAYNCILKNYSGDHPLTARLVDPSGGITLKAKKYINTKMESNTRWFSLNISITFIFLILLHFDYIKDIGDTIIPRFFTLLLNFDI